MREDKLRQQGLRDRDEREEREGEDHLVRLRRIGLAVACHGKRQTTRQRPTPKDEAQRQQVVLGRATLLITAPTMFARDGASHRYTCN